MELNKDSVRKAEAAKIDFQHNFAQLQSRMYGSQTFSQPPANAFALAKQREIQNNPNANNSEMDIMSGLTEVKGTKDSDNERTQTTPRASPSPS